MKKTKILTPVLTIGTLGAAITPMTILTSCGSKNTGKDANLAKGYDCEVTPAPAKTYNSADEALAAYLDKVDEASNTNAKEYKVLKDDARYSYAKAFQTPNFKQYGELSSYTLDFPTVVVDKDAKTMDVVFNISVNGNYTGTDVHGKPINITEGKFECTFQMDNAFWLEFCEADDTTYEKINYIKCHTVGTTGKYTLSGTCKFNGYDHTIEKKQRTVDISIVPSVEDVEGIYGYIAKELILSGLTCNIKMEKWQYPDYGVIYTNYMSLAKIG